jgi:multimeric flavodoxin WrbA
MKKILGIIGSPRKSGNTDVLVSRILEGARDNGAKTEGISLADLRISECDGCHACWKGKHVCNKADDMRDLYPKIIEADAIVFGTPVYWFGPTAIMKCFIDRFVYFNCPTNRRKIRNKVGVIAVPFEDRTYKTSALVVDFFAKSLDYLEMRLIDKILVPGVTKRGEVRTKKQVMSKCHELGRRLAI